MAEKDIKNIILEKITNSDELNMIINCIAQSCESNKNNNFEQIKIFVIIAEIYQNQIIEFLPKIFFILNNFIKLEWTKVSKIIGEIYEKIMEYSLNEATEEESEGVIKQIFGDLKNYIVDSTENERSMAGLFMLKILEGIPNRIIIRNQWYLYDSLIVILSNNLWENTQSQFYILDSLLCLLYICKKEFLEDIIQLVNIITTYLNNKDYRCRKSAIDIIYICYIIDSKKMKEMNQDLINIIGKLKSDKNKEVRKSSLITLKIIKEDDENFNTIKQKRTVRIKNLVNKDFMNNAVKNDINILINPKDEVKIKERKKNLSQIFEKKTNNYFATNPQNIIENEDQYINPNETFNNSKSKNFMGKKNKINFEISNKITDNLKYNQTTSQDENYYENINNTDDNMHNIDNNTVSNLMKMVEKLTNKVNMIDFELSNQKEINEQLFYEIDNLKSENSQKDQIITNLKSNNYGMHYPSPSYHVPPQSPNYYPIHQYIVPPSPTPSQKNDNIPKMFKKKKNYYTEKTNSYDFNNMNDIFEIFKGKGDIKDIINFIKNTKVFEEFYKIPKKLTFMIFYKLLDILNKYNLKAVIAYNCLIFFEKFINSNNGLNGKILIDLQNCLNDLKNADYNNSIIEKIDEILNILLNNTQNY